MTEQLYSLFSLYPRLGTLVRSFAKFSLLDYECHFFLKWTRLPTVLDVRLQIEGLGWKTREAIAILPCERTFHSVPPISKVYSLTCIWRLPCPRSVTEADPC